MHLCSISTTKITVTEMALSPECFVCFRWDLQNWKEQSFNLTTGMEGITQLLKSNFEQSKCKWRHQCHTFGKKETFFLTCPLLLLGVAIHDGRKFEDHINMMWSKASLVTILFIHNLRQMFHKRDDSKNFISKAFSVICDGKISFQ